MSEQQPVLQVRKLAKYFPMKKGQVRAVDGVDFDLYPGECLGLVGESGSGKTTVGRAILRAITPTAGDVLFRVNGETVNLATAPHDVLRGLRRHLQMIFQDPYSSLNPRMTVADIVGEPLLIHGMRNRREREEKVRVLLQQVGLQEQYLTWYPHAFSGGQRQRIGIARALALEPQFIVADEPVSALDISMQAQVLNLLQEVQQRMGLTYLLISHDLGVVRHIADRIAVIYLGRIVEMAPVEELFTSPAHPYTETLLSAMPALDPAQRRERIPPIGDMADPADPPPGCHFHPRCRYATDACKTETPELREIAAGHTVRCMRAGELTLGARVS
ncbi:MAG: ABC transporter ATP-binding protein [Armatimonadota bacterium]